MDRQFVDIRGPVWTASSSADGGLLRVNWARVDSAERTPVFTHRAWYLVKLYLADRLTKRKMGTVASDYEAFLTFEQWLTQHTNTSLPFKGHTPFDWSDYTEGIARGFLAHGIRTTASKGKHFSQLRSFYRWGVARSILTLHRNCFFFSVQ